MKNVVLIGDSIRLNYQDRVKELLSDICIVHSPPYNCGNSLSTVHCIRKWFTESVGEHVDLIHWNNGAWEHHRNADDHLPFSTVEQYLSNLSRLHRQFRRYTDRIIWATSTPGGEDYSPDSHILLYLSREDWNKEIALYNDAASAYLKAQGVHINDLYHFVYPNTKEFIRPDGLHLSAAGVEAVAGKVAAEIRAMLQEK